MFWSWFFSWVRGAAIFVTTRKGGSCTQGGKPGTKETGTPEGVPRTAAITRDRRHKNAWVRDEGAVALVSPGYHTRSLNGQRRPESIPSKKSATRHQSAQTRDSEFAYKVCGCHPILRHLEINKTKHGGAGFPVKPDKSRKGLTVRHFQ